jgi:hypothetical protein
MTLNNSGLLAACAIPLQALPAVALSTPIEKPPFHLDFTTEMPSGAALERASSATYFDAAGVLQSAGVDTARFDHNPDTLAALGLYYEPSAATNNLLQSTPTSSGVWGSFGTITLTTGQPGLGGATSATKITPQALGSSSYRIRQNYEWTAAEHTVSCDVKATGWQWVAIHFNDLNLRRVWFDIINGVVGATQGGAGMSGEIEDLGNGHFRLIAHATTDLASGLVEIWASGGNGSANISATPNGTDAFLIENIQVDDGHLPTSRIITTAAPATRAAETLTIDIPASVEVIRFTHDDNSYTEVEVTPGAPYEVPELLRPWIKSVEERPALPATFKPAATAMATPDLFAGGTLYDLNGVTRHYFPEGCDWVEIGIANWFTDLPTSALVESGPGFPMTVATSVTTPGGRVVMVPWGGSATGTVADGTTGYSDRVFVGIQPGEWAEFNTYRRLVGSNRLVVTQTASDTANGERLNTLNGAGNLTMTPDAIVDNIGTSYRAPPTLIRGNVEGRSFVLVGDSRTEGAQDTGASSDHGELSRALNNRWPYLNMGVGNDRIEKFLLSHTLRLALAQQFTDCIEAYGVNDVAAGGRSAAQLLGDGVSFRALLPGLTHWKPTLPPFGVGGTYTTLPGQTVYISDSVRTTFNDALRAGISGVTVIEAADAIESARNSGKFRVDLGALTTDGTHENALGNQTISTAVTASIT